MYGTRIWHGISHLRSKSILDMLLASTGKALSSLEKSTKSTRVSTCAVNLDQSIDVYYSLVHQGQPQVNTVIEPCSCTWNEKVKA